MIFRLIRKAVILILAFFGVMFIVSSFSGMTGKITGMIIGTNAGDINSFSGIFGVLLIIAALLLFIQLKFEEKKLKK